MHKIKLVHPDIIIASLIFILLPNILFGAGSHETKQIHQSGMAILDETETTISFREAEGNIVEIPKYPKRVIVTLNSILDIWYMSGGTSLARVKGSTNVPEAANALPILGGIGTLNTEMIMQLEPDLLIVSDFEYQKKVRDFFSQEGIPGLSLKYSNYDEFLIILDLFTKINGTENLKDTVLYPIQNQVNSIINQVPETPSPRVCIIFTTVKSISVETPATLTGDFCAKLGAQNIYPKNYSDGKDRVYLSLEYILENDPDIIFVTSMGDVEKCRTRLKRDIISSDIWGDLSAVKNNRFFYLEKEWYLYKPNQYYPEAFKKIAESLYPDTDFSLKQEPTTDE